MQNTNTASPEVWGNLRSHLENRDFPQVSMIIAKERCPDLIQYVCSKLRIDWIPELGSGYYKCLIDPGTPVWIGGENFPHRPDSHASLATYLSCFSQWNESHVQFIGEHFKCQDSLSWARDAHIGLKKLIASERFDMSDNYIARFLAYWMLNKDYSDYICRGIWYRSADNRELQASPRGGWSIDLIENPRPIAPEYIGRLRHDVVRHWALSPLIMAVLVGKQQENARSRDAL